MRCILHLLTNEALQLIDSIDAKQLEKPWQMEMQVAYENCKLNCKLEENVRKTIGTQCIVYLFDPGNGWSRDSRKRGDMLIIVSKLVEKGVRLEGISHYGKKMLDDIQWLIDNPRNYGQPAKLNDEVIRIFSDAGYKFSYPVRMQNLAG